MPASRHTKPQASNTFGAGCGMSPSYGINTPPPSRKGTEDMTDVSLLQPLAGSRSTGSSLKSSPETILEDFESDTDTANGVDRQTTVYDRHNATLMAEREETNNIMRQSSIPIYPPATQLVQAPNTMPSAKEIEAAHAVLERVAQQQQAQARAQAQAEAELVFFNRPDGHTYGDLIIEGPNSNVEVHEGNIYRRAEDIRHLARHTYGKTFVHDGARVRQLKGDRSAAAVEGYFRHTRPPRPTRPNPAPAPASATSTLGGRRRKSKKHDIHNQNL